MAEHHQQLFDQYSQEPTSDNLNKVVSALEPTISYNLASMGAGDSPAMKAKAKVLTSKAIKTYDPSAGTGLPTWVSLQLMPLRRTRRQMQTVVKIPERIQQDAFGLAQHEQEFIDQHGREPSTIELADRSHLSMKRIEHIRKSVRKTPSESAFEGNMPGSEADHSNEALDYLYHDADHLDRRILELKTGYGGVTPMEPKDVAIKLNLTPSQLSRRSARLTFRIQEIEKGLSQV